jgi:hypothetical protein
MSLAIMVVMLYTGFTRHRHTRSSLVTIFYRDGFVFFLFLAGEFRVPVKVKGWTLMLSLASSVVNIVMLVTLPVSDHDYSPSLRALRFLKKFQRQPSNRTLFAM